MYDCSYCSQTFTRKDSLTRHINTKHHQSPTMYSREKDIFDEAESESEEDYDDDDGWKQLVEKVRRKYDNTLDTKIDRLMKTGLSEEEAKEQASIDMHHLYKRDLIKNYKQLMINYYQLKPTSYQKHLMEYIDKYADRGMTREQAVQKAVRMNSLVFDDILSEVAVESDKEDGKEDEPKNEEDDMNEEEDENDY